MKSQCGRLVSTFAVVSFVLVLWQEHGYAIPAFARKYHTSCVTCHIGFPKLNAFGEAFRRNGYQFPAHTDPEFIKQEEISLGSDGNKKSFPDAVWPSSIAGSSPISLFLDGEMDYNPKIDPRFTFDGLGNAIETAIGGTFGDDLSYWAQASFSRDGLELNRMFLIMSNIIGDSYALNGRLGVIEPSLFSFSTHRAWMEGYWFTTRAFDGSSPSHMGWTFEETQKGLEFNGILTGRMFYSAGIVEGYGPLHADKDYYGHIAYKIGGLPLDGVLEAGQTLDLQQPYLDNSFTLGGFVYSGNAWLGQDSSVVPLVDSTQRGAALTNNFTVVGGDFNAWFDRFNLFGAVSIRKDNQPFLEAPGLAAKTTSWFSELDVVVYPWLLPGIRFESWTSDVAILSPVNPSRVTTAQYNDVQIVPGIVFLLRPNVKMTVRSAFSKLGSIGDTKFQPGQTQILMTLGM